MLNHQETPVVVSWAKATLTEHRAVLVARIERRGPFAMPLNVSLKVPDGAHLVEGEAQRVLEPSKAASVTEQSYAVTFDRTPDHDLIVTVEGHSDSFGVTAQAKYGFGRADAAAVIPAATGPDLQLNGVNLGPAVRLDSTQKQ